jgi:hypothetical protein
MQINPANSAQAKEHFLANLRAQLDGLVTLLTSQSKELEKSKRIDPTSPAYHAVEIVQFARYIPAAELCVQLIDTRSTAFPVVSDEKQAHFPFFPFAVAAAAIGTPAVPGVTANILTAEPATTRFQLSCLVLKEILGQELAEQHLANVAKNDTRASQHLQQATRLLQTSTNAWEATFCSDYAIR